MKRSHAGAWRALNGHLMAPLIETATITGELLGDPNDQIRKNLTGDQPRLFTPWLALSED